MTTKKDKVSDSRMDEDSNYVETAHISQLLSEHFVLSAGRSGGQNFRINKNAIALVQFHVRNQLKEIIRTCRTQMCIYKQNTLSFDLLNNVLDNHTSIKIYGNSKLSHCTNVMNSYISKNVNVINETLKYDPIVKPEPSPFLKGIRYEIRENVNISENTPDNEYYFLLAKVILHPEKKLWKIAHQEIKDNPRIHSIASHLLNLVHNAVQQPRERKVTKVLIETVDALVDNKYLDHSYTSSTSNAVDALINIALEKVNDGKDYTTKVKASRTLAKLFLNWSIEEKIKEKLNRTLADLMIHPENLHPSVNYGIVVLCTFLGGDFMDTYIWPNIEKFLTRVLKPVEESMKKDHDKKNMEECGYLKSAILNACSEFYRHFNKGREIDENTNKIFSDYFGDDIEKIKAGVDVFQELKNKEST